MLDVQDLYVEYDGVRALNGVSIRVHESEVVVVLGSNGAGKTTVLSAISGLVGVRAGRILWEGRDIAGRPPHDIVAAGISHVPERRRIFGTLSVHENLLLGGTLVNRRLRAERIDRVYGLLPKLAERRSQDAGTLSGGEQQMLAIGRAMVAGPRLLMLDEPSMGLAPSMIQSMMKLVIQMRADGVAILLIEQNARAALKIADRGYVLETGTCAAAGTARELSDDDTVVEAYLGG